MDKTCLSAGDSANSTNPTNNRDQYLKQLNKLSHKISKPSPANNTTANPLLKKTPAFDHQNQPPQQTLEPTPPPQQHQPPVYNINKNDFRDVVQKLTGSPAHERFSNPPPIHQPKPPSSRLQRIRPPPLAHVSNRPPPMLSCAAPPIPQPNATVTATMAGFSNNNNNFIQRPTAPLSPLPPLPAVHAAAESPVSAYMRYLQFSMSAADPNSKPQFSGFSPLAHLVSPRWNNSSDTSQQQGIVPPSTSQQQMLPPQSQSQSQSQLQLQPQQQQQQQAQPQFPFPSSPLPFGYVNSPRSPYPLLSPRLLFSPTSGQLNIPLSPTVPVPSPIWRGL